MLEIAPFLIVYFLPAFVGFYRKHYQAWHMFALS